MNHDEILQAAKEAGIEFKPLPRDLYCEAWLEQLEHLAAIIEKRTIERCEAACNSLIKRQRKHEAAYGIGYLVYDAEDCAAAIRKLGEQ